MKIKANNFIGFHKPDEPFGFLSNWYQCQFIIEETTFSSVEQYMMYKKAYMFDDINAMDEIMKIDDPYTIKKIGRKIKNYDNHIWAMHRQIFVYNAVKQKFCQNDDLWYKLIDLNGAIIAECSKSDQIWGIGLSIDDPNRLDTDHWRGHNLLGGVLMAVSQDLLNEDPFHRHTAHR